MGQACLFSWPAQQLLEVHPLLAFVHTWKGPHCWRVTCEVEEEEGHFQKETLEMLERAGGGIPAPESDTSEAARTGGRCVGRCGRRASASAEVGDGSSEASKRRFGAVRATSFPAEVEEEGGGGGRSPPFGERTREEDFCERVGRLCVEDGAGVGWEMAAGGGAVALGG